MVATAIYSVTMLLWKETAFPLCRAMERRWKRNVVSRVYFCDSGDTPANLLCELNGILMPCSSCFYGKWVEDVCAGQLLLLLLPGLSELLDVRVARCSKRTRVSSASVRRMPSRQRAPDLYA